MKIVVLGGGFSGFTFIKGLRKFNAEAEIILIDKKQVPYDKAFLSEALTHPDTESFVLFNKDFVRNNNLSIIVDEVEKVSFSRKKVYFKKEKTISYDKIIIASGLRDIAAAIPGVNKEGVYSLWESGIYEIKTALQLYENIVVSVRSAEGINIVADIAKSYTKKIRVYVPEEQTELVHAALMNLRAVDNPTLEICVGDPVQEAVGDSALKALKLSSGKFIAADVFIYEEKLEASLAFLDEEYFVSGKPDKEKLFGIKDVFFCGNVINDDEWETRGISSTTEFRVGTVKAVLNKFGAIDD